MKPHMSCHDTHRNALLSSECQLTQYVVRLQGFVYLKFVSGEGAAAAHKALNGRWFAGRQIAADFQFPAVYQNYFRL